MRLGGRAWTWLIYVPATVGSFWRRLAARVGPWRQLPFMTQRQWLVRLHALSPAPCDAPPAPQAASVLFAICSLVTFGDLAQVQYEVGAEHVPPGAAAFHLSDW